MPNIKLYVNNEMYVKFLQRSDDERKDIRLKALDTIKDELDIKNGEEDENN